MSTAKIVDNKQDWTVVTGTFTAEGNEKFLVIGAFTNGGFESSKVIDGADNQRAYYYLDGVSLTLHPEDDRDHDGVPDAVDRCPDVPGIEALGGGRNPDGDGVAVSRAPCPDEADPGEQTGCPDPHGA